MIASCVCLSARAVQSAAQHPQVSHNTQRSPQLHPEIHFHQRQEITDARTLSSTPLYVCVCLLVSCVCVLVSCVCVLVSCVCVLVSTVVSAGGGKEVLIRCHSVQPPGRSATALSQDQSHHSKPLNALLIYWHLEINSLVELDKYVLCREVYCALQRGH